VRIDAHQHFWRYHPAEFGWIGEGMEALQRDFLPAELKREIGAAGIDGVVSVQAQQSLDETLWLLELAAANDFIKGVVGWVPLASAQVRRDLELLAANPKLKGVRHVLQGEPEESWLHNEHFNAGIDALKEFGLVYDLLIFERQLPAAIKFVDRHPSQIFVLDHLGKPRVKDGFLEPWNRNIRELAKRENVICKISGLVTEADWLAWTEVQLQPYVETVLEAFGSSRVMFGSDWPVCRVASDYSRWVNAVERLAGKLSLIERTQILGETASEVYRLKAHMWFS
jgi:L-fuconolactonase